MYKLLDGFAFVLDFQISEMDKDFVFPQNIVAKRLFLSFFLSESEH